LQLSRDDKIGLASLAVVILVVVTLTWQAQNLYALLCLVIFMLFLLTGLHILNTRKTRRDIVQSYRHVEALFTLYSVLKFEKPLPPMTGHAITPVGAKNLVSLVMSKEPEIVVEYGSGVSTLIIAYCLRQLGRGKVISYDHEKKYAEKSQCYIDEHDLNDFAEVIHAPLVTTRVGENNQQWLWYDLNKRELPESVDIMIVDGPPRKIQKLSRYPALASAITRLKPGSVILLDDSNREEEQEIIQRWLKDEKKIKVNTSYSALGNTVFDIQ
jgi:predicted O-methyltransferase YrrM